MEEMEWIEYGVIENSNLCVMVYKDDSGWKYRVRVCNLEVVFLKEKYLLVLVGESVSDGRDHVGQNLSAKRVTEELIVWEQRCIV